MKKYIFSFLLLMSFLISVQSLCAAESLSDFQSDDLIASGVSESVEYHRFGDKLNASGTMRFFSADLEQVCWWARPAMKHLLLGHRPYFDVKWISPKGSIYKEERVKAWKQAVFVKAMLPVKEVMSEELLGDWRVEAYLDQRLVYRRTFGLVSQDKVEQYSRDLAVASGQEGADSFDADENRWSILSDAAVAQELKKPMSVGKKLKFTGLKQFIPVSSKYAQWGGRIDPFKVNFKVAAKLSANWYSPDDNLFMRTEEAMRFDPQFLTTRLPVAGADAAELPGEWRVEVFLGKTKIDEESFFILPEDSYKKLSQMYAQEPKSLDGAIARSISSYLMISRIIIQAPSDATANLRKAYDAAFDKLTLVNRVGYRITEQIKDAPICQPLARLPILAMRVTPELVRAYNLKVNSGYFIVDVLKEPNSSSLDLKRGDVITSAGSQGVDVMLSETYQQAYEWVGFQLNVQRGAERMKIKVKPQDMSCYLSFHVLLGVAAVNAVTDSTKNVFVTEGLLDFVKSEDELSLVIGHEVGHVVLNHYERGQIKHAKQELVKWGLSSGVEKDERLEEYLATFKLKPGESALVENDAAKVNVLSKLLTAPFTKQAEFDADAAGYRFMRSCGYSDEAIDVIQRLGTLGDKETEKFRVTHPAAELRYDLLNKLRRKNDA